MADGDSYMRIHNQKYIVVVESARERAYNTLRKKIISLELPPGTMISTQEVADYMSISRTPVREAFLALQRECLLEISHQKPSMVSLIDRGRVQQEYFTRKVLEIENMRLFAANPSEEMLGKLKKNISQQKEALEHQEYERYQELDNEFHLLPFTETGQELAASIISQMNGHYNRVRMMIRRNDEISNDIIGEHEQLLESIGQRNAVRAVELLQSHIQALQPLQDRLVHQWPEYFV